MKLENKKSNKNHKQIRKNKNFKYNIYFSKLKNKNN